MVVEVTEELFSPFSTDYKITKYSNYALDRHASVVQPVVYEKTDPYFKMHELLDQIKHEAAYKYCNGEIDDFDAYVNNTVLMQNFLLNEKIYKTKEDNNDER